MLVVGNKCTHYRKSKGARNTLHFAWYLRVIPRNALLSWPLHSYAPRTCFTYTRQLSFYLFHSDIHSVSRPQSIITAQKKLLYTFLFRGNSIESNSIIISKKYVLLSYYFISCFIIELNYAYGLIKCFYGYELCPLQRIFILVWRTKSLKKKKENKRTL